MIKDLKPAEQTLVARLHAGDKTVIADLYDAYSATLYGVVTKILRDEEEANDVLQEAFVSIWKYGKSFDAGRSSLFTWMLNIARNKAIDKLRAKKRKGEIQNVGDNVYLFETGNSTEHNTDTIGLTEMVDELDEEKRVLIDMAYFGGYTQQELAEKLEVPLGTVKTRMRAAMKELRKRFT